MNALILHGTSASSEANWFSWLEQQLQTEGWHTYVPDLPDADIPIPKNYNELIDREIPFKLDRHTVLIGHSSGAVAALQYLQHIRPPVPIHAAYLVSGFTNDLDWDALQYMFSPELDYPLLQTLCEEYVIMHSEDDPYVPISHAHELTDKLDGTLIAKEAEGHFNTEHSESYSQFPELLELILAT